MFKKWEGMILNPRHEFVWDNIWHNDVYRNVDERRSRAQKRVAEFRIVDEITRDGPVLDVACGTGDFLAELNRLKGIELGLLIGVDKSPVASRLAHERHSARNIYFVCSDSALLPFPDASMSSLFLFGVVEHVLDADKILAEAKRVLKTGGRIYVTTSNALSALQIKNWFLARIGRYPYGYQKNWNRIPFLQRLSSYFHIEGEFVSHADWDMPVVCLIDRFVGRAISSWGRYICVKARKDQ